MSLDTSYENVDVVHGYVDVEVKILKLMIVLLYVTIRDQRFPDSPLLFPGMPPMTRRKGDYTAWLKQTLVAAIPAFPKKHLRQVRPHGWRAGWVCDRRKQGTPDGVTMREGRWSSKQAMGLYDRTAFSVVCPVSAIQYVRAGSIASNYRRHRRR